MPRAKGKVEIGCKDKVKVRAEKSLREEKRR